MSLNNLIPRFAHIDFSDVNEARSAMTTMNGSDFEGRRIRIDFAGGKGFSNNGGSSRRASRHDSGPSRFDANEFSSSTKRFDNDGGNRHQSISNSDSGWGADPTANNNVSDQGWDMQPLKTETLPATSASSGWGQEPVSNSGNSGWGGEPFSADPSGVKRSLGGWGEEIENDSW